MGIIRKNKVRKYNLLLNIKNESRRVTYS